VNTPAYLRPFYFMAGLGLVGLGYLGLILPVMPGTIFFILALGAFRRSSAPLENWLLENRLIGPTLRDWDARGAIRPRTKAIIQFMLWGSIIGSCYSTWKHIPDRSMALALIFVLIVTVAAVSRYIATRPSA
jgi:uncharacterized membrane protein YbaN (DUF454 family)